MRPTTSGRYRVFEADGEEWLFVEVGSYDPRIPGRPDGADDGDPAGPGRGPGPEAGPGSPTPGGREVAPTDAVREDDAGEGGSGPGEGGGDPGRPEGAPGDRGDHDANEPFEPVYVPRSGHGDLDEAVAALRPGYLVDATLAYDEGSPLVTDLSVHKRTLFEFVPGATTVFQAAREAWAEAARTDQPINSTVTRSTDREANGALYVFAEPPGTDLFGEFRSAPRPLEPLIARVNERHDGARDAAPETPRVGPGGSIRFPDAGDAGGEDDEDGSDGPGGDDTGGDGTGGDDDAAPSDGTAPDREVFVIDPADDPFVIVFIVLRKGGQLADAVRDTYARPRPDEPLG